MKKKTNKILPKAQYAGGMGPGGKYPGRQPNMKTPPPRGNVYYEDAAPLREGYTTPQQWVNTWNPTTNSYDRTLKEGTRDPNFGQKKMLPREPKTLERASDRMKKGGSVMKSSQLRRQASSKGLRTSKKHK